MSASPVELIYKGLFGDVSFLRQLSSNHINALVQIDAMANILRSDIDEANLERLVELISVDVARQNSNDDDIFTFIITTLKEIHRYTAYTFELDVNNEYYDAVLVLLTKDLSLQDRFIILRLVIFVPFYIKGMDHVDDNSAVFNLTVLMVFVHDDIDQNISNNIINTIKDNIGPSQSMFGKKYVSHTRSIIQLYERDVITQLLLYYDGVEILNHINKDAAAKYSQYDVWLGTDEFNSIEYSQDFLAKLQPSNQTNSFNAKIDFYFDLLSSLRNIKDDEKLKKMMNTLDKIPKTLLREPWLLNYNIGVERGSSGKRKLDT